MAQITATNLPIDKATLTHEQHVDKFKEVVEALLSTSYGSTRPAQIAAGGLWVGPGTTTGDYVLYMYDGSADAKIAESFYWESKRHWRYGNSPVSLVENNNPGADYNFAKYLYGIYTTPSAGVCTYKPVDGDIIVDAMNSSYGYVYHGDFKRWALNDREWIIDNLSDGQLNLQDFTGTGYSTVTKGTHNFEVNPRNYDQEKYSNYKVDMDGVLVLNFVNGTSGEDRDPAALDPTGTVAPPPISTIEGAHGDFVTSKIVLFNWTNGTASLKFTGATSTSRNGVFRFINKLQSGGHLTAATSNTTSDSLVIDKPTGSAFPGPQRLLRLKIVTSVGDTNTGGNSVVTVTVEDLFEAHVASSGGSSAAKKSGGCTITNGTMSAATGVTSISNASATGHVKLHLNATAFPAGTKVRYDVDGGTAYAAYGTTAVPAGSVVDLFVFDAEKANAGLNLTTTVAPVVIHVTEI